MSFKFLKPRGISIFVALLLISIIAPTKYVLAEDLEATITKGVLTDSDKDGVYDDWELKLGSNPKVEDTDGDGFMDGNEMNNGFSLISNSKAKQEKAIFVRLSDQSLHYTYGSTILASFKISSGLPKTPTPTGKYEVLAKRPVVQYGGKDQSYYYPNTKWNLMFKRGTLGNYYIHGAYWHSNFGHKMSHGCVNVAHSEEQMGRLYNWATVGTPITIIN